MGGHGGRGTGTPWAANRSLGEAGEDLAARYLTGQGMEVLDRNWRCPAGELDLVLADGEQLVFCEVKTRRTQRFGTPVEAVGPAKAGRLRRLAYAWLSEHDWWVESFRIDVVGVLLQPTPRGPRPRGAPPPEPLIEHQRGVA